MNSTIINNGISCWQSKKSDTAEQEEGDELFDRNQFYWPKQIDG